VYGLAVICLVIVGLGLRQRKGAFQFPTLAAMVVLLWFWPQVFGLKNFVYVLPEDIERLCLMAALCMAALTCGFQLGANRRDEPATDAKGLGLAAGACTVIGLLAWVYLFQLPEELTSETQWTGLPVAVLFFVLLAKYGMLLALALWLSGPNRKAMLWIFLLAALPFAHAAVFAGRRAPGLELVLAVPFVIHACTGWQPKRRAFLLAALATTFAVHSIGDYRARLSEGLGGFASITEIDVVENIVTLLDEGGSEARNAAISMAVVANSGRYDFGAFQWDAAEIGRAHV